MGNNDSTTNNPNETTQLVRAANANTHDAFVVINQSGRGIVGTSQNAFPGVAGAGAANGIGVAGQVGNGITFTPTNIGVHGQVAAAATVPLNPGQGVRGDSQISAGVFGVSTPGSAGGHPAADGGIGVAGFSPGGIGVRGDSSANPPLVNPRIGVLGVADQNAVALAAPVQSAAVYGLSNSEIGGVVGQSNSGVGVQGASSGNVGVLGQSTTSVAVFASSASGYRAVYATSSIGTAIVASTNSGNAIQGASNGNVGVLGSSNSSIGGLLRLGHEHRPLCQRASGGLRGALRRPGAGEWRLYGARRAEVGGRAPPGRLPPAPLLRGEPRELVRGLRQDQLVNGRARVRLDPDFNALVQGDRYQVFLTPEGDCNGLYVSAKNANGFEVRELKGGTSTLAFSYRVVAKRRDIVGPRLEKVDLLAAPALRRCPAPPVLPPRRPRRPSRAISPPSRQRGPSGSNRR